MTQIISILIIAILLIICKQNRIKIHHTQYYSFVSISLPFIIASLFVLSSFNFLILLLFLISFIFGAYYYINKAEEYLSLFKLKDSFHLIVLFLIMGVVGFLLTQSQSIATVLTGISLMMYARYGFTALTSLMAQYKNRSKYLGFLAIFLAEIGVIIVCLLKPKDSKSPKQLDQY